VLGAVDTVWWRSGDDRFDDEGFLVKPPDFVAGKKYPLLVDIHGGPRGEYQNSFTDVNFDGSYHTPPQVYAAHGYLVLLPNKRGDDGYGSSYVSAHTKHWGDDVTYDMLAGVDALTARGFVDSNRVGVMGASYGGYATAWAIAHANRFKAASIQEGPINLLSYYSQAYLGNDAWMEPFLGGDPSTALEEYLAKSPILFASKIETPTLLAYGEARFPRHFGMALQGMELYRALHSRGIPVEFLYFPGQGHVIAGEASYRDWVARNVRWFDHWLGVHGDSSPGVGPTR
jgi:dipeptidyl aminopeptidase/acylaminoacyl peptidase